MSDQGAGFKPYQRTAHEPSLGKPDAFWAGAPSQPADVMATASSICGIAASRSHFSDTAFVTPSSGTNSQSLSGLYSFSAAAIREVFSPKFC